MVSVHALLSIVVLSCVETIPWIKKDLRDPTTSSMGKYFDITNYVCHAWFTFEYAIRLSSAADKIRYIKTFDSLVDMCAIVPFYVQLLVKSDFIYYYYRAIQILRRRIK